MPEKANTKLRGKTIFFIWKVEQMIEARKKSNKMENIREKAISYCDNVKGYFDPIRDHVDALEMLVDDEMWPLAKYRELVTIR